MQDGLYLSRFHTALPKIKGRMEFTIQHPFVNELKSVPLIKAAQFWTQGVGIKPECRNVSFLGISLSEA